MIARSPGGTLRYIVCEEGELAGKLQNLLDDTDSEEDLRQMRRAFEYAEPANCRECARLSECLERAQQTNQAGRGMLAMNAGTASVAQWRRLCRVSEESRLGVERARLELEWHRRRRRLTN